MRGFLGLLVVAGLIAAAVFFADHPGRVEIVWQGWQVDTSVGVLMVVATLAGLLVAGIISVIGGLLDLPQALLRRRRAARRRAGYAR